MTSTDTGTRSVVVEREIAYPPEKIWRALTQPHLIAEWLMRNDFAPVVGHRFDLTGVLVNRDDGRFVDDNALAARVDQRVGGSQINGKIARKDAEQRAQVVGARAA